MRKSRRRVGSSGARRDGEEWRAQALQTPASSACQRAGMAARAASTSGAPAVRACQWHGAPSAAVGQSYPDCRFPKECWQAKLAKPDRTMRKFFGLARCAAPRMSRQDTEVPRRGSHVDEASCGQGRCESTALTTRENAGAAWSRIALALSLPSPSQPMRRTNHEQMHALGQCCPLLPVSYYLPRLPASWRTRSAQKTFSPAPPSGFQARGLPN